VDFLWDLEDDILLFGMNGRIFKDKTILITGGTGSFGSFFVKKILQYKPRKIIIFSRDEDKQYWLQKELKNDIKRLRFVIGDVREKASLLKTMRIGVDILIHAAALKQIPSTEYNIIEAVKTNILGAQNVVDASIEAGVGKVLSISTDKAVEPVNVMGMTKALQERIFILGNKQAKQTKFASVRYGNVVASRGSVIPLFKKQIEEGGPVTVTDKRMTRFIFTLSQATELVFNALDNMVGGEIFIPKIRPLKVFDLAQVMVNELQPKNKNIKEIGIRSGEKLHETLISPIESLRSVRKRKFYVILPQIELKDIGFTYKTNVIRKRQFRYASDTGPFITKSEIKKILKDEGLLN